MVAAPVDNVADATMMRADRAFLGEAWPLFLLEPSLGATMHQRPGSWALARTAAPRLLMTDASASQKITGFEIRQRLGSGGMAEVFLAEKRGAEGTSKLLVVKRVLPAHGASRRFRTMFVEEAQLATRLNHPNIVQVYEFSDHGDEGLVLSMEYVEGFDLGKLVSAAKQRNTKIPPYVSAFIVGEAAKGLHYAHERKDDGGIPLGIVHRDVSPQNILLSYDGVVKIADFGIATANMFREEPGVLKGKFGYMSPEQARGERVDRRSDVYALGVVLYELLALRSPYDRRDEADLIEAVRNGRFEPPSAHNPDTPPELEAIVLRALANDRSERFQSARDLAGALARTLFAREELTDSSAVEATLLHLLGRELRLPSMPADPEQMSQQTIAAAPIARSVGGEPDSEVHDEHALMRVVREVRHVAVVTLRLQGMAELEAAQGAVAGRRTGDGIRSIVDHIAYKHGALWSWESDSTARTVVGLMANPSRAAADSAALAIDVHEALAGASEDLPVALRAAISIVRGIASGERDDQGHLIRHHLQEPANFLADQLGARTPFGRTWVAGGLYRLVRRDFRWGDAPTLDVEQALEHNVPEQMRVYLLLRPLTREERIAEIALAPSDLVGRDAEKADLHAAYHRAVFAGLPSEPPGAPSRSAAPKAAPTARGVLVTRAIVGEMGIGKTALVATFLAELPSAARVLHVECSPVKIDLPFATVADLLRAATGIGLDQSIDDATLAFRNILGAGARSAQGARIISRLAELASGKQLDHADEDASSYGRDLVVTGVRYMLGALAQIEPVVIVIDGLQWADRPSLELLHELLKRQVDLPILVLLVARPEERVDPYLDGIVRSELRGLSPEEQIRLVETRLGLHEGVSAVCSELVPRVAGNPFFLLEMLDALLERGTLAIVEQPDGRPELVRHHRSDRVEALPSTLAQLISDRVRELPSTEHEVVEWLAVAGGPLLEAELIALMRLVDDEAITRLCARGLCDRRGGSIDFRHPIARDVTYAALDASRRVRMHRRLGEHLATTPLAQGLSAAIVARHLARGEAPMPAAELYLEAAFAARHAHQTKPSTRYFLQALGLLPAGDVRRLVAHESLESIFRDTGRRRDRIRHLTRLRKLAGASGSARWAALALARTARLELDEGHLAQGRPIVERAIEVAHGAKQAALEVEAETLYSEILRELGDTQGAIEACERALRVAQTGALPQRSIAEVLRAKGVLLRYVGRIDEAIEAYASSIAVFQAAGARRSEARAKNSLAYAMFVLERFEDVIALGLSSIAIDLAIGGRFQIAKTLSNVGQAYARLGDMERGLAYLHRAREAHERYADQDSHADTLLCLAGLLLEAGDPDAAQTLMTDASALIAVTQNGYDSVHEKIIRALLALRQTADAQLAVRNASEARQLAESQGLVSYHLYATAIEAAARAHAGELSSAELLARTAFAAIEAVTGSEYGIEIRALCCEALTLKSSESAQESCQRAVAHVFRVADRVRDPALRKRFLERTVVQRILTICPRSLPVLEQGNPA
jgi:serine/threonine protein kinase/predicted ATPase